MLLVFPVYATAVHAQEYPTLTLSPNMGMAGSRFEFKIPGLSWPPDRLEGMSFGDMDLYSSVWDVYPSVPANAKPGTYTITAKIARYGWDDEVTYLYATALFTVIAPKMTLSRTDGTVDSTINFVLSDWLPGIKVDVSFSDFPTGKHALAGYGDWVEVTTDSSGSATGSIKVPNVAPGLYTVHSYERFSGAPTENYLISDENNYVNVEFLVTNPGAPSLAVSVSAGPRSITTAHSSTVTAYVSSGGSPVSGASVSLTSSGGTLSSTSGITGANGQFVTIIKSDTTGTFTITAEASMSGYNPGSGSTQVTVTKPSELVTISKYYGTEVYVKHANSAEWIELSDPTNYVVQIGDTIATIKNTIIQVDLGSHGFVTLDPDSTIFIHTVSESDVTFSVTGKVYQKTSDTVTVVNTVVGGVPVEDVTDTSTGQASQNVGDPQFTITTTNTSALIRVFEGVVTLNDPSGHSVSIDAGYQSSVAMNQAPTTPEPINDVTPPSVLSVFPVSQQSSINESMPISVTFSEAIDPRSAFGSNFTITDGKGAPLNGYWTALCQTVIFTPESSIQGGTYVVDVKGGSQGVRDLSGNALPSDYTFSFTVGGALNALSITVLIAAAIVLVIVVAIVVATIARRRKRDTQTTR